MLFVLKTHIRPTLGVQHVHEGDQVFLGFVVIVEHHRRIHDNGDTMHLIARPRFAHQVQGSERQGLSWVELVYKGTLNLIQFAEHVYWRYRYY